MTPCPPQDIQISAVKIGEWFIENNITNWKLGHCASREMTEKLEKQRDELLAALERLAEAMSKPAYDAERPNALLQAQRAIASVKGGAA